MDYYYLTIELIIDLIAVFLGIAIIRKPTDNRPKFYWGIIAVSIGLMFIWENTGWILIRNQNPTYEYTDILNIEKMLKWFALAGIVSLFPTASLRPGYLNRFRILIYLLPPLVITTVGISYYAFNGTITEIDTIRMIPQHLDKPDVKLRLLIFSLSVLIPFIYFIGPVLHKKTYRSITPIMYLFIGFMFLLLGIYISFTLFINDIFFNGFGIVSLLFCILFSVLYLRSENPLSSYTHRNDKIHPDKNPGIPAILPLYHEIESYLKTSGSYTSPNYNITLLATRLEKKEYLISAAIKSGGHTGFREYINYLRLEHFKEAVKHDPYKTIKELMYECGFTSRSTFYRNFSEQYGITPTKYIESQVRKPQGR